MTETTNRPTTADAASRALLESTATCFRYYKDLADRAIAQLDDGKLRVALDANTNSIAVIMKHIAGNLCSRWTDFLTTDGEKPWRNRDEEFVDTFSSRQALVEHWQRGWGCVLQTLERLEPADLAKTVVIRGEPHAAPLAIQRSLSHTAYHVGQIVQIARILAGDAWQTLTIPRGKSAAYNAQAWGTQAYAAERESALPRPDGS